MKAMLIGINFETGDVKHEECSDIDQGWGLRESIKNDFPGYEWFVMGDDEARKEHGRKVAEDLFGAGSGA